MAGFRLADLKLTARTCFVIGKKKGEKKEEKKRRKRKGKKEGK